MTRKPQRDILKESMKLLNHWSKRETKQRLKQQLMKSKPLPKTTDRKIKLVAKSQK